MNNMAGDCRLRASLEEFARFGCPVDLSVAVTAVENENVEIEQVGGILESHIFQLEDRRVACIADIVVTNQTSKTINLIDVELRTPWDHRLVEWVKPFQVEVTPLQVKLQGRAKRKNPFVYEFPGEPALRFAYEEVINHHLLERKRLTGGRPLEGLLLGIGGFMPDNLLHGDSLEMPLTIIGADHAEYTATIHFWTERLYARPTIVKMRRGLLAKQLAELMKEEPMRAPDGTRTPQRPAGQPSTSNRT
jgi:hypothetical protein